MCQNPDTCINHIRLTGLFVCILCLFSLLYIHLTKKGNVLLGGDQRRTVSSEGHNESWHLEEEAAWHTYHSWWINLILPVQTQGWYSGLSGVPSERHTRQISAIQTHNSWHLIEYLILLTNAWQNRRVCRSARVCICVLPYHYFSYGYIVIKNINI